MRSVKTGIFIVALCLSTCGFYAYGQPCTTLGQTPATAFPVCGTSKFEQKTVPLCVNNQSLYVPGCGNGYPDQNPFYYKFTCFVSGTLGFTITPNDLADDYDWQLYDVTGINLSEIFTNRNIVVAGNWAGNPGPTGASATGADWLQCGSRYDGTEPRFAKMPQLIAGREYILMVSHFTNTQSGYSLTFGGGTAVITDPTEPHMQKASPSCDGTKITLKLNKKMKCSSLSSNGSEFSLVPATTTVVSAVATNCTSSFDFDEITLTLAAPLGSHDYQLVIKDGSDGNTILDNCDRGIPAAEQTSFKYTIPQPIPIDSVAMVGCAPSTIKLHFSKKINCSTIAPDGSNFTITGPHPVTVVGASGICTNGLSDVITVQLASPVYNKGIYTVIPKLSVNGGAVVDECGQIIQPAPVNFEAADTVSALFTYDNVLGCRMDTITFSHDGLHDVNQWSWNVNGNIVAQTPSHTMIFPATGTNTVDLIVSNGICSDTTQQTIVLDNEVIADFNIPPIICPEDALVPENLSKGLIDTWRWSYDVLATYTQQQPAAYNFPAINKERNYVIKLVATNDALGCSDSTSKPLKVLANCYIAVPTAFTPNGDGLNDYLYPTNAIKADNLRFQVFNRWGQRVFSTSNWQVKWNGKVNGIDQDSGVYVWFLEYTHRDTGQRIFQKGTTTLIR